MDIDFDAILALQAKQAERKAQDRAQPLRSVLGWAPRHARGAHSQDALRRARKAQNYIVEKIHEASENLVWEKATGEKL